MHEPRNDREAYAALLRTAQRPTNGWAEHAEHRYHQKRREPLRETIKLYAYAGLLMGAVYLLIWVALAI